MYKEIEGVDAILDFLFKKFDKQLKNQEKVTNGMVVKCFYDFYNIVNYLIKGYSYINEDKLLNNFPFNHVSKYEAAGRKNGLILLRDSYYDIVILALKKLCIYGYSISDSLTIEIRNNLLILLNDKMENDAKWSSLPFKLEGKTYKINHLKWFLATTSECEIGTERAPKRVKFTLTDIEVKNLTKAFDQEIFLEREEGFVFYDEKGSFLINKEVYVIESTNKNEEFLNTPKTFHYKIEKFVPRLSVVRYKSSSLGLKVLLDVEEFMRLICEIIEVKNFSTQNLIDKLLESNKPNFINVAKQIIKADQDVINEFSKFVCRAVEIRFLKFQGVINNWRINQTKQLILIELNNSLVIDFEYAKRINKEYNYFEKQHSDLKKTLPKNKEDKNLYKSLMKEYDLKVETLELIRKNWSYKFLNEIGINIPEEAFNEITKNTAKWTNGTRISGLYGFTKNGNKPRGLISVLVSALLKKEENEYFIKKNSSNPIRNFNPLYTETTACKVIAKLVIYQKDKSHN